MFLTTTLVRTRRILMYALAISVAYVLIAWILAPLGLFLSGPSVETWFPGTLGAPIRFEHQITVLAFLAGTTLGIYLFLGPSVVPRLPSNSAVERGLVFVAMGSLYLKLAAEYAGETGWVLFASQGAFNYLAAAFVLAGLQWRTLPQWWKVSLSLATIPPFLAYTISNSRAIAIIAPMMIAIGWLMSDGVPRRRKVVLGIILALVMPGYLLVSNQTRYVLGTLGFSDMDDRAEVMLSAMQGAINTETGGALTDAFARLQNAGGQTLVFVEWERDRDHSVDFGVYLDELVDSIVPKWDGSKAGSIRQASAASEYLGSELLTRYGFTITESTDVEISFLASLFFVGGLGGVIFGSMCYGALLAALSMSQVLCRSTVGRVVTVSIGYQALFAMQYDPARILKSFVFGAAYLGVAAVLVRFAIEFHTAAKRTEGGVGRL
jgi:hypothetical protein